MKLDLTYEDIRRFWSHVNFNGENGCWEWDGHFVSDKGNSVLPQFHLGNQKVGGRRVSYLIHLGNPPKTIRVTCGNDKCVNPRHMLPSPEANKVIKTLETNKKARGKTNEKLVGKIVTLRRLGRTQSAIAKAVNLNQGQVCLILKMAKMCREGKLTQKRVVQKEI